jgi:hypothetical protein
LRAQQAHTRRGAGVRVLQLATLYV